MDATPLPAPVAERDALLALWAVPGVGSVGLGEVRRWADGRWADLLATPVRDWVDTVPLADAVRNACAVCAHARRWPRRCERAARGADAGCPPR